MRWTPEEFSRNEEFLRVVVFSGSFNSYRGYEFFVRHDDLRIADIALENKSRLLCGANIETPNKVLGRRRTRTNGFRKVNGKFLKHLDA